MFENWIEEPFSKADHAPESAINLAQLYWQGQDPTVGRFQPLNEIVHSSFEKGPIIRKNFTATCSDFFLSQFDEFRF